MSFEVEEFIGEYRPLSSFGVEAVDPEEKPADVGIIMKLEDVEF